MATATFDKDIFIDNDAADRLIDTLSKPPTPVSDVGDIFKKSEEVLEWLLSDSKT
jgi:hypothetical protein